MKEVYSLLKKATLSLLIFAVVLCGVYPLLVWGVGQLLFPNKANGSLLFDKQGTAIGSKLIGENFSAAKYFHPRPSYAGSAGYDGTNSSASNFGPTSKKIEKALRLRAEEYRKTNNIGEEILLPIDAVTSSGSGLDPHISIENALLQLPRVAKARGVSSTALKKLLKNMTENRSLGILGEPRINVLLLNLKLDEL